MLELVKISKSFKNKQIISDFSLSVKRGEFISIVGESGKGKTTLLNIIGLLEDVDNGKVIIDGNDNITRKEKMLLQRYKIGYLFQNYALIENETVEKNLLIALAYRKNINKNEEIRKALDTVGLSGFEKRKVYELSGGEQQRIALARVILKKCDYILADEPTGNLDINNRNMIFNILEELNNQGKTIIFVTHDLELANKTKRTINL
ncbi:bacteriocin ABC transporter ATP-binding protein [Priestia aryabhattai]|uniref:Bacteriocin ABC transporter ATP-binding protein n=2 Tax=Priestia TaxID=2800373 RepID=A0A0V8JGN7_9BACI|nr:MULTISPECIES: putative bacteriocin export ABC transporter [Priestia]OZT11063.1 bacteriocin ABC transporter ATP-binding protein [Priestia aryabhattai]KSU86140.1 bacteriocin ABC transporter ATP-binding protein [Priestia veravalensis]MDW8518551.1 putative bacteriocin export ABC transporter [Priestia flexa]MEC0665486.1 putative bacteriocin export ABC transporter [Priestia flexa]SCC57238.1 putative ABC transport system ATP-binding protein [Priestia flexa]